MGDTAIERENSHLSTTALSFDTGTRDFSFHRFPLSRRSRIIVKVRSKELPVRVKLAKWLAFGLVLGVRVSVRH